MKRSNTILAAAFLLVLGAMAAYTALGLGTIRWTIVDAWHARGEQPGDTILTKIEFAADQTEGALNAALDREHYFIQLYGAVQRATGQRLIEDSYSYNVVRMDNGSLSFGTMGLGQQDVSHNAMKVVGLAQALAEYDIPVTASMAPQKVLQDTEPLPGALRDYHNLEADQYLSVIAEHGIHTIDLRDEMEVVHSRDFFVTDHHWTAHGAFQANGILTPALAEAYGFDVFETGLDSESYTVSVLEDYFLGSQGKRVGTLYAGVDDFAIYHPTFDTSFRHQVANTEIDLSGTLEETLYFPGYLVYDLFNASPYSYFAGGDLGKATITNRNNPDGPRVVMLRDSFACAITPFLALQCGELTTIDLRAYEGEDLVGDIAQMDPDFVLVFYSPTTTTSDNMFEFIK